METTFFLPEIPSAEARILFADKVCRIERMDAKSCNVVWFDQEGWDWFEQYADENNIKYELV